MSRIAERLEEAHAAYRQKDIGRAAQLYRAILVQEEEGHDQALQMLGVIAQHMGKLPLALDLMKQALVISPAMSSALVSVAVLLRQLGQKEEAWQAAQKAVELAPQEANAWHTTSFLSLERRDFVSAVGYARKAVDLQPDMALYLINLANGLMACGALKESYSYAQRAVAVGPDIPAAHLTLAQIERACGYPDLAVLSFDKALALQPDYRDAKQGKAAALSVIGDWEQAWPLWEARLHTSYREKQHPEWSGEKVDRLLIYAEQGLGDTLLFSRWLPFAQQKAGQIFLQVPLMLKAMLSDVFPDISVITVEDPLSEVDAQVSLVSLPYLAGCTLENIPMSPVLKAPQKMREAWRSYLSAKPYPRIGIVWEGNPGHANDHNRSIPRKLLEPLLKDFGQNLISLQNGQVMDFSLEEKGQNVVPAVLGSEGLEKSLESTAALMSELDLLITIDSMPAHLAGVLGIPVWLFIPFDPDWRWLYGRDDSVWYPSVRLFRQKDVGDWNAVIARVHADLMKVKAGQKDLLSPLKHEKILPLRQHPEAIKR